MSVEVSSEARSRVRIRVTGTVQGVGFRPFVYRLASELGLAGFVLNDARGVVLEVEGSERALERFHSRLRHEAPPLAVLERVRSKRLEPVGTAGFEIRPSPRGERADAPVVPDAATCTECLHELFDPADRRYRYPFINCTNCGPRFTIVRGIPYDRPFTTMAGFTMCPACVAEYEDPVDRRFHAQPNACPQCGPSVRLLDAGGEPVRGRDARDEIEAAAIALREGAILAVKGIGGYHLACRADDEAVVATLRARKHREDKPFALMARSAAAVRTLVTLDDHELMLLESSERPIVLAPHLASAPVARSVAPGARELGVMLPYSPLHHLLLADAGLTLVMTSGNVSDEPIAFEDADALKRLSGLADLFLIHDRPIETRTDDSVMRSVTIGTGTRVVALRRSRGYVPAAISLPSGTDLPLLACGAELKSTFCLAKGERAWVSHHIGDLENYETLRSFQRGIVHFRRLFAVDPQIVAHDLHPEYLSTKYALECDDLEPLAVQHHHAHLAAVLAEHGVEGPAIGAIFDGAGFGSDGTVWGGELLHGDLLDYERLGSLLAVRLPGGERAVRQPWRMACAWLTACGGGRPEVPHALAGRVAPAAWRDVRELVRTGVASPLTSSIGRLFDAIAALCGIRAEINYEGQAAIELERVCDPGARGRYPLELGSDGDMLVLDPRETVAAVVSDLASGTPVGVIASRFHRTVACATVDACTRLAAKAGTELAVLSGGVFQNRVLLGLVADGLSAAGLRVLIPERLPASDGGISYGQAAIAAARLRREGKR